MLDADGGVVYKNADFNKTVYDSNIISDSTILDLGQQAASSGYTTAVTNGLKSYNAEAGGISFRIYLDPKTGLITNFHPRWQAMSATLFNLTEIENDPDWVIKEFFNSVYFQGEFISAVDAITAKRSYVINEEFCLFPEPESPDSELHFEGVKFGVMNEEVVVAIDKYKVF